MMNEFGVLLPPELNLAVHPANGLIAPCFNPFAVRMESVFYDRMNKLQLERAS
jgi:hypothetical protein